jgi:hypothetical protein
MRAAYLPALTQSSSTKPTSSLDLQLRTLFSSPPNVVIIQGVIAQPAIDVLWSQSDSVMGNSTIYLSYALHQEIQRAIEEGEAVEEANLSCELQ